ncbi:hypothetical protein E0F26_11100 [Candidatus Paraluminiphilus aquimaris]|uniref:Uncharacterized protein n=1 Tax=Candidatus Paraluminiphilus aquimaris TaxID=2518994 RepID=A0ABY6Q848_9GAMM|nr:hypothetical protein [Candidatus Paraluminiphilus aquimaris]UZP75249.1 hypothetical protein E0F26_11100 [Candidatus Paraluminiphilus aquimaris]
MLDGIQAQKVALTERHDKDRFVENHPDTKSSDTQLARYCQQGRSYSLCGAIRAGKPASHFDDVIYPSG